MSRAGLRFQCQTGCVNCCDQRGFVYLTEDDMKGAAKYIGMTAAAFEEKYIYRTKHLLRFRKPKKSQCHFLQNGGCAIHPAKPTQCRVFPYWPELVEDRDSWNETGKYCPGIGTGPLIQIGTALEVAEEMKVAYPTIYRNGNKWSS